MLSSCLVPLQDLSGRHALEGAQRQMHQVVDDLAAERGIEAAAGVARDVAAQRAQRPFEQEQGDHAEHQHVERLERAVVDHLVVHGHQEQQAASASRLITTEAVPSPTAPGAAGP